jgi:osmotically-inducible protein OsmY
MADRWMDERDRQARERAWRQAQARDSSNQDWSYDPDGDNYRSAEDRSWEREQAAHYYTGGVDYPTNVSPAGPASRGERTASGGYGGRVSGGYGSGYRSRSGPGPEPRPDSRHDVDPNSFMYRAGERVASWLGGSGSRQAGPSHRGRGPQGYTRSDERINDDVHDRLTDDHALDASNIAVAVAGGEVTLSGTVDSRHSKHRAERLVEDIGGVKHVQNNLRVAGADSPTATRESDGGVLDAQARGENPGVGGHHDDGDRKPS